MKKLLAGIVLALGLISHASAYSGTLVDDPGIATTKSYVFDLQGADVNVLSAQSVFSNSALAAKTFSDGRKSTATITVTSVSGLVRTSATNTVTITTLTGIDGTGLATQGVVLVEGVDWRKQSTTALTAANLCAAMQAKMRAMSVSCPTGSVIYTTATATGQGGNALLLSSSKPSAVTVATPNFTGGVDNAVIRIGTMTFTQGSQWSKAANATVTAHNIAIAIGQGVVTSTNSSAGVIVLTAASAGTASNFQMVSSTQAALTIDGVVTTSNGIGTGAMRGGLNSDVAVGSANLTVTGHSFTTALPVLLTATTGRPAPLTDQVTYYAIPVSANVLKLSLTSTGAVAGLGVTITASTSSITKDTFTLTPVGAVGDSALAWEVSNDGVTFTDIGLPGTTITASGTPASDAINFGLLGYRYLQLTVTPPATRGALDLLVSLNGSNVGISSAALQSTLPGSINSGATVQPPLSLTGQDTEGINQHITSTADGTVTGGGLWGTLPTGSFKSFLIGASSFSSVGATIAGGGQAVAVSINPTDVSGGFLGVGDVDGDGIDVYTGVTHGNGTVNPYSTLLGGPLGLKAHTKAELVSYTPKKEGLVFYCSNCSATAAVISTGTARGAFADIADRTAAPN